MKKYIPALMVFGGCFGMGIWCAVHGDPDNLACMYFALSYLVTRTI